MSKVFEFVFEAIGWLQIVASPFLIGLGIGTLVYLQDPTPTRFVIGLSIAALSFVGGAVWATKIMRKKGTIWFMSRVMATPELDKPEAESANPMPEEKKN